MTASIAMIPGRVAPALLPRFLAKGDLGNVGDQIANAVYAFTFGQYIGYVAGLGPWFARTAAVAVMAVFIGINLRSVGQSSLIEVVLVWVKLAVLVALAATGLWHWNTSMLSRGVPDAGVGVALFGAAAVFMAYEGFQLLAYDYDDIARPDVTLPRAVLSAIVLVVAVYVAVTLGIPMLIGADAVMAHKEVALAVAGERAWGTTGLVVATVAAAFSTGSAINSTLFATARLSREVTRHGQLPSQLDHENRAGVPDRAVISLGLLAAVFAAIGTLSQLVQTASLAFLGTFSVVCALAFHARAGRRVITAFGALASAGAAVSLAVRIARTEPLALVLLFALLLVAIFGRPWLLRHVKTHRPS